MNKSEIVEVLSKKCGISKNCCEKLLDELKTCILESCLRGEDVFLRGFGKFSLKDKKKRRFFNPQTKRFFYSSPKKVIEFRISKSFSEVIK